MAVREILRYPKYKKELRRPSLPISEVDQEVVSLITDLKETLLAHPEGIGLAAPQINRHLRAVVVRLGSGADGEDNQLEPPLALLNPEIVDAGDPRMDFDGCLSFPGLYGKTVRPHFLHVTGWDQEGKPFRRVFEGFDAVLVHHEIDHLDGVLFIDRARTPEDLYRVGKNEDGEHIHLSLTDAERQLYLRDKLGQNVISSELDPER